MNRAFRFLLVCGFILLSHENSRAQSREVKQLVLNLEKLSQLKSILKDMQRGYEILSKGYKAVKDVSEGNFKLHQVFMDGLLQVSPTVQKYYKIGEILAYQKNLVSQFKSTYGMLSNSGNFSVEELAYLSNVYSQIAAESLRGLERLLMVVTAGKLRMADDERLRAIDAIHGDLREKNNFMQSFCKEANLLGMQRDREREDLRKTSSFFKQPN